MALGVPSSAEGTELPVSQNKTRVEPVHSQWVSVSCVPFQIPMAQHCLVLGSRVQTAHWIPF